MHEGFNFLILDVLESRRSCSAPDELYDILVSIGSHSRYMIKATGARTERSKPAPHPEIEPHRRQVRREATIQC
jgi:fructose 1,6-bisphosphatase